MDDSTVARLNQLNRDFYRRQATSFDAKRQAPWPGWERVATLLADDGRHSILDVGCGNGRFGLFLRDFLRRPFEYTGVDSSRQLLNLAAARGPDDWRFLEADLVVAGLPAELGGGFGLVGCFGVMHHLPGESTRRRVLQSMARQVAPGGYLAVSFWQFGDRSRFLDRALDWDAVPGWSAAGVEAGDFLLPWGSARPRSDGMPGRDGVAGNDELEPATGPRALRYCHFVDRAELRRLIDDLDLVRRDEFVADGASADLNRYVFLQRARQ